MKRFFLIVFTLALFLCLASCGVKAAPSAEAAPQQSATPTAEVPLTLQEVPAQPVAAELIATETPTAEPATVALSAIEPVLQEQIPAQPQSTAVNDEISATANGYTIEVLSAELSKDYNGNNIILVKYKFTNANSISAAFWQATDQTVKQNGQKLSPEGIVCDDPFFMNSYSQISGGQSIVCAYPYPMLSATDPLDVTASIYNYNSGVTVSSASGRIYIG